MLPIVGALAGLWEAAWWARRRSERTSRYRLAQQHATYLGRPLLVVGAPDGGVTSGYGCGDITCDLFRSNECPVSIAADITKCIPLQDDSVVVFVSCVLEYVDNFDSALRELVRVSGGNMHIVRVEPWTLTAYLYPSAKRTLPAKLAGSHHK